MMVENVGKFLTVIFTLLDTTLPGTRHEDVDDLMVAGQNIRYLLFYFFGGLTWLRGPGLPLLR